MGNSSSSDSSFTPRALKHFGKTGSLGLSKAELDRRCQPSGLYPHCQWDDKAIRRQIGDGRLAARLKGHETRRSVTDRECPICFLQYSQINVTKCCHAHICTECFLQVRPQKEKLSACPFCNHSKVSVTVAQRMGADDIQARETEEQRVIEAKIRARGSGDSVDSHDDEFGSSLEQNSRVARLRARSESFASENNNNTEQAADTISLEALAMTPEERRELENEMKLQHSHPLALREEAEAAERQLENQREYYRTLSGRIRETARSQRAGLARAGGAPTVMPAGPNSNLSALQVEAFARGDTSGGAGRTAPRGRGRDWNQIVDAFERGGNGAVNSLDDLVVMEAAILLSMEEEARRASGAAAATSREDFDAARHARDGFPLVQNRLVGRDGESSSSAAVRARNDLLGGRSGFPPGFNSNVLMGGISEEEQMAMAIAASLQDQQATIPEQSGESDDGISRESSAPASEAGGPDQAESETAEGVGVGIGVSLSIDAADNVAVGVGVEGEAVDEEEGEQQGQEEPLGAADSNEVAVGEFVEEDDENQEAVVEAAATNSQEGAPQDQASTDEGAADQETEAVSQNSPPQVISEDPEETPAVSTEEPTRTEI